MTSSLRFGFITGSLTEIGSGQAMAVPLARALQGLGHAVHGVETTRIRRRDSCIDEVSIWSEPMSAHLPLNFLRVFRAVRDRRSMGIYPLGNSGLDCYDMVAGNALLAAVGQLGLDVLYAFHNTNVARVLPAWPHPSRLLVINLVGFGIDPSRGGVLDTFPLQEHIFARPSWDLHVAATRFECRQYQGAYQQLGLDVSRLIYIPHSFDPDCFYPPTSDAPEPRSGMQNDVSILLYPVNVYPRKNVELALAVLEHLNRQIPVRLIIAGRIWDSQYHAKLLQLAQRLGVIDRVQFEDGVSHKTLVEFFHKADVTIFTSHQETYGIGIVESLGSGTPVVGPDWIIPCAEILAESPGAWAASKDPDAFADRVLEVLRTTHHPGEIAKSARARYGNGTVALQFLDAVQRICKEKREYTRRLQEIDWKSLYSDAGDLL